MAPCVTGLCTKEGEDVIETDDIVKKFLASVLRLHI